MTSDALKWIGGILIAAGLLGALIVLQNTSGLDGVPALHSMRIGLVVALAFSGASSGLLFIGVGEVLDHTLAIRKVIAPLSEAATQEEEEPLPLSTRIIREQEAAAQRQGEQD